MSLTALYTGTSGLAANSSALDVIGNNLANLNTTGYKTQRTEFKDLVYQSLYAGSAGAASYGSTNAIQQGFGVQVGAIDSVFQQGAINPTSRPLDAALQGAGFFVLSGASGKVYSRDGSFNVDSNGYLVDPSSGDFVQRYGTVGESTATSPGFQTSGDNRIKIPFGVGTPAVPTANINFQGNIDKSLNVGQTATTSIQMYDTSGGAQALTVTFTKTGVNTFSASASIGTAGTATVPPTPITFDTQGLLVSPSTLPITISGISGAASQTVTLNLGTPGQASGISQFGGASTVTAITQDGSAAGNLSTVSIDQSGTIQGQFTNGRSFAVAQLSIASFNNTGGLIRIGQNEFTTGSASGEPLLGVAGTGGRGTVQGAALEGSNVDIASEFAKLIIAQRGYQVNSKVITAANETLQEVANIIQ